MHSQLMSVCVSAVIRCNPIHLVGRLSAILGWRSTQVICTDQSWSFWCQLQLIFFAILILPYFSIPYILSSLL